MPLPFTKSLLLAVAGLAVTITVPESGLVVAERSGSSGSGLVFSVIGDWGDGRSKQDRVAKVFNDVASRYDIDFTVSVGDNFYSDGVSGVNDPQFKDKWQDIYTDNKPWYLITGNHDWHRDPMDEVKYSKLNGRWNMPDLYYDKVFDFEGASAHFVFIDTEILAANQRGKDERNRHLAWIEDRLSRSTSTWLFVVGHYPVFTVGSHGPNSYLIKNLVPLLKKYNVNAYFAGHDHISEFFNSEDVAYVVSGDGGRDDGEGAVNKDNSRNPPVAWYNADNLGGLAVVSVKDATSAALQYVMADGSVGYEVTITNTRQTNARRQRFLRQV